MIAGPDKGQGIREARQGAEPDRAGEGQGNLFLPAGPRLVAPALVRLIAGPRPCRGRGAAPGGRESMLMNAHTQPAPPPRLRVL